MRVDSSNFSRRKRYYERELSACGRTMAMLREGLEEVLLQCPHSNTETHEVDHNYGDGFHTVRMGKKTIVTCLDCGRELSEEEIDLIMNCKLFEDSTNIEIAAIAKRDQSRCREKRYEWNRPKLTLSDYVCKLEKKYKRKRLYIKVWSNYPKSIFIYTIKDPVSTDPEVGIWTNETTYLEVD